MLRQRRNVRCSLVQDIGGLFALAAMVYVLVFHVFLPIHLFFERAVVAGYYAIKERTLHVRVYDSSSWNEPNAWPYPDLWVTYEGRDLSANALYVGRVEGVIYVYQEEFGAPMIGCPGLPQRVGQQYFASPNGDELQLRPICTIPADQR